MKTELRQDPRRRGRTAKLPKMNNSERGKYYRRKYKEHEVGLEQSIDTLRKQVRDLELFLHVKNELMFRNPNDRCESVVANIFEYFDRARGGGVGFKSSFHGSRLTESPYQSEATSSSSSSMWSKTSSLSVQSVSVAEQFQHHSFLFFDLESVDVRGCSSAPVVVMGGLLHTKYTQATIDTMFPHLVHYPELLDALLDKQVQYPCTYQFHFGSNGAFQSKIVEADYVGGLQQVVGNLEDVMWLLDGSHKWRRRHDSLENVIRGPSSMALNYILS